jgi:hypothetical protein
LGEPRSYRGILHLSVCVKMCSGTPPVRQRQWFNLSSGSLSSPSRERTTDNVFVRKVTRRMRQQKERSCIDVAALWCTARERERERERERRTDRPTGVRHSMAKCKEICYSTACGTKCGDRGRRVGQRRSMGSHLFNGFTHDITDCINRTNVHAT